MHNGIALHSLCMPVYNRCRNKDPAVIPLVCGILVSLCRPQSRQISWASSATGCDCQADFKQASRCCGTRAGADLAKSHRTIPVEIPVEQVGRLSCSETASHIIREHHLESIGMYVSLPAMAKRDK